MGVTGGKTDICYQHQLFAAMQVGYMRLKIKENTFLDLAGSVFKFLNQLNTVKRFQSQFVMGSKPNQSLDFYLIPGYCLRT